MRADEYQVFFDMEDRHFWFRATRSIVFHQARARIAPSASVLDVGCGTGGTMASMPKTWRRVGIDYAPEAIGFAGKRGERNLARASAEGLPFPDATFDAVFALDVIEHCNDDAAAARELSRVLKPGGTLVLTVPAFQFLWSQHDVVVHHKRRYRRDDLARLLNGAGVSLDRLTYYNTLLFPPIAAVKLFRRLIPGGTHSDNSLPPEPINGVLTRIFGLERRLLDLTDLPFGVSLLAVGTR